ncbi:MAG: DEAD/DEAH box helicase [Fusobacteriaceae bacterium]
MKFNELSLDAKIIEQTEVVGYQEATPIQEMAIPLILQDFDILGLAKTGTGKTAAFVLPMLHKIATTKGKGKGVRGLIIAPTRELAEQINNTILLLGKTVGIKSITMYGGVPPKNQLEALKNGADIIVGCPGRLLDHIQQKNLGLTRLEFLILDEADHMLDMGFLKDIEKIIKNIPKKRQTMFFSATMPKEIKTLAFKVLKKDHKLVEVEYKDPVKLIEHQLFHVEQENKKQLLLELLNNPEMDSLIVFTNGKFKAKHISNALVSKGIKAVHFQGNLSQTQRDAALSGFRSGEFKVLVATDIAARGLDIPQVTHVINFDIPQTPEAFIHRSGRTGRANKSGVVYSFNSSDDKKMLSEILRVNKTVFSKIHGQEEKNPKKIQKKHIRKPKTEITTNKKPIKVEKKNK